MGGYTSYNGNSSSRPEWYPSKDGSPLVTLKDRAFFGLSKKKREDTFLNFIRDNQSVVDLYKAEPKFSFDFIQTLIKRYNLEAVAPVDKKDI